MELQKPPKLDRVDKDPIENKPADFNSKDWWSYSEIGKALEVSREKLIQLVNKHLSNKEWFSKDKRGKKLATTLYRDLVLLLEKEVIESRNVPEGWKTARELAPLIPCDPQVMSILLRRILQQFPNQELHSKSLAPQARTIQYFSPEVWERALKHFEIYPIMPIYYHTEKQLAHGLSRYGLPNSEIITPKLLQALKKQEKITGKLFTGTETGEIVEGFPVETLKQMINYIIELKKQKEERERNKKE